MNELQKGTKHEKEHIETFKQLIKDVKAGKVKPMEHYQKLTAKDHIKEHANYYTELSKMEKKLEKKEAEETVDLSVLHSYNPKENESRNYEEKTASEADQGFLKDLGLEKEAQCKKTHKAIKKLKKVLKK